MLDWIFSNLSEWELSDDQVRVEFDERRDAPWAFPLMILVIISALEVWNWMNLQPFDVDPLVLAWAALLLAGYALLERRIPTIARIVVNERGVEVHDTDANQALLSPQDKVLPELEKLDLGEKTLWSVRLTGPTVDFETPPTSRREGPHRLNRALERMAETEVSETSEMPESVTCEKVRTYGGLALLLWMLGLAAVDSTSGEDRWWLEPLIGCVLVLPYAIHGLRTKVRVRLRRNSEGSRLVKVGMLGRWRPLDDLFVGLRGNALMVTILPRDWVREGREFRIALYRILFPPVVPRGGVEGALAFAREVRGREARSE